MDEPLVSIVLPTHNGQKYIAQAVESCISQSYENIELVVVDDCSSDSTRAIVEKYLSCDKRLRLVALTRNHKLPSALNVGFRHCKGDLLTWTSDDNMYERDAIQTMAQCLRDNGDADFVYCDYRKIDCDGNDVGIMHLDVPDGLSSRNCVGACFMYSRKVYEAVGEYATDMYLVEDYEYWLRVQKKFRMIYLKNIAPYRYRLHPMSLTARHSIQVPIQLARAKCRHIVPKDDIAGYLNQVYCDGGWHARNAGRYREALGCYLGSMREIGPSIQAASGVAKVACCVVYSSLSALVRGGVYGAARLQRSMSVKA